jgi:hypothetical protein
MSNKYDELKEVILTCIKKIRCGDATLDDLENEVVETTTVQRSVVYHPVHGSKSVPTTEVKKCLKDGWYSTPADFPPERPETLTFDQWEVCDSRLEHEWGLSLSSFVGDVLGLDKNNAKVKEEHRDIYEEVIAYYGDKIEQTERNNCMIWKRKKG